MNAAGDTADAYFAEGMTDEVTGALARVPGLRVASRSAASLIDTRAVDVRDAGRRLDALITRTVPEVRKGVRWNSPFYGMEGQGWFLAFHCFTKYIKITFLKGTSLRPPPPVASKDPNTRYFHIHENDEVDEEQLADWIRQASRLPGWIP